MYTLTEVIYIILTVSLTSILSGLVTGLLVFRTKRESYERMFPQKPRKSKGAINIDEFAAEDVNDDGGSALPDSVAIQNKVFGSIFGTEALKK